MGKELSFTVENKKLKQRILELEKELANSNSNNVLLENKSKSGVRYKTILEGINDSVFVQPLQKEGYANFIEVNQVACKKLGYTREELLNMAVNNITTVREAKLYSSHQIYKKLLTKKKVTFETIHIRKDGKKIDVEITASMFELDGKHIIMSVAKDITERKKQKKWLKKNEYILNETQKLSKIGGWEYRLHDKRVIWTDELFNIYGIPIGKIPPPKEWLKFYHKDYVKILSNLFNKCVTQGEKYDIEAPFVNAKGKQMWVRTIAKPIYKNNNVYKIIGNVVDITKKKKNELEIVKLTNAIKQSPVSIVITNTTGDIEFVNPKFIEVTGYDFNEVTNQNPRVLKSGLQSEDFYLKN